MSSLHALLRELKPKGGQTRLFEAFVRVSLNGMIGMVYTKHEQSCTLRSFVYIPLVMKTCVLLKPQAPQTHDSSDLPALIGWDVTN